VNVAVLNVRSGPGTSFQLLSTVTIGTRMSILQKQGDWLQVRLPSGQTGWVALEYTTITEVPPSQSPVTNIPAIPATPDSIQPGTVAVVMVAALHVRTEPSIESPLLSTVAMDTGLPVQQKQGDWLQVATPDGQTGWVFAAYTNLTTGAPEIRKLAVVTVSALNARTGPSTDMQIVSLLSQGTTLPIIAEQGDWLQVQLLNGQTAWIAGQYTTVFNQQMPSGGSGAAGPSPLAGKKIVIDPGHGGANSGAIGLTGLFEKAVTLDVSLRLAAKLRQAGATVIMTRHDDSTVYLAQRVTIAEAAGAHAFVSVHANAHPDRRVSGTETYYFRNKTNYVESYYLAAHLQSELVKALGLRDIGVKHGNFHVIRETTMPSALVELAFLSNAGDEALLKTDKFRENSALAIFRGLERFFQF
jgi:N-acetylmuramoyl-L-alanine amidase